MKNEKEEFKKRVKSMAYATLLITMGMTMGLIIEKLSNDGMEVNIVFPWDKIGVQGTGSMLPTIQPDAMLETRQFDGTMKCGHIYIYRDDANISSTETIVHRYVYEGNDNYLYFKGDNNPKRDPPVNKEQILFEVIGIE